MRVTNTGTRPGTHVVQVYAERSVSDVERPARWLAGFERVDLAAGDSADITIAVRGRELAHWDGEWRWESGEFTLLVGSSVVDTPVRLNVSVK